MEALMGNDMCESFCSGMPYKYPNSSSSDCSDSDNDSSRKRSTSTPLESTQEEGNPNSPPKRLKAGESKSVSCVPLLAAIQARDLSGVNEFLRNNPGMSSSYVLHSPLHLAVKQGDIGIIKELLSHQFDVNASDTRGETAVQIAVENCSTDAVELLLMSGAGATINMRNKYGCAAIHTVVRKANPTRPVKPDIPYKDYGILSKEQAITMNKQNFKDNFILLKVLLGCRSVDINLTCRDGKTALYYAVVGLDRSFSFQIVELLLAHGADVNVVNMAGKTALSRAITLSRADIIERLLQSGADARQEINDSPISTIQWGIAHGRPDITELLLNYSSFNVNDPELCRNHPSLLHYSLARSNARVTRCLINAGADFLLADEEGVTPFLYYRDNESAQSESNRKLLLEHLVLLESQKRYSFSKEELDYILKDEKQFQLELHLRKLNNEMLALKGMKIPSTEYTFHDFAGASDHYASQLVQNPSVIKYCSMGALQKLYPGFCQLMYDRFKAGQARVALLDLKKNSIENLKKFFFTAYQMEGPFVERLFKYLKNRDLKQFLIAFDTL